MPTILMTAHITMQSYFMHERNINEVLGQKNLHLNKVKPNLTPFLHYVLFWYFDFDSRFIASPDSEILDSPYWLL